MLSDCLVNTWSLLSQVLRCIATFSSFQTESMMMLIIICLALLLLGITLRTPPLASFRTHPHWGVSPSHLCAFSVHFHCLPADWWVWALRIVELLCALQGICGYLLMFALQVWRRFCPHKERGESRLALCWCVTPRCISLCVPGHFSLSGLLWSAAVGCVCVCENVWINNVL